MNFLIGFLLTMFLCNLFNCKGLFDCICCAILANFMIFISQALGDYLEGFLGINPTNLPKEENE